MNIGATSNRSACRKIAQARSIGWPSNAHVRSCMQVVTKNLWRAFWVSRSAAIAILMLTMPNVSNAQMNDFELLQRNLLSSFAASKDAVTFPIPLSKTTIGLVYFDRSIQQSAIVAEENTFFTEPSFSRDGMQMLFVRYQISSDTRTLFSCRVNSWNCQTVLQSAATIMSPIFVDKETILYASSPIPKRESSSRLAAKYDFYLLKIGSQPVRLTEYVFGQLTQLDLAGSELVFQAVGQFGRPRVIPKENPVAASRSSIFAMRFDAAQGRIEPPKNLLTPLYVIDGYSMAPSISADGQHIAFLNTKSIGRYRFNLVVARRGGEILKYIGTTGIGFSRPAFVDDRILANELFNNRYQVRRYQLSGDETDVILDLDASSSELNALRRINIKIDP